MLYSHNQEKEEEEDAENRGQVRMVAGSRRDNPLFLLELDGDFLLLNFLIGVAAKETSWASWLAAVAGVDKGSNFTGVRTAGARVIEYGYSRRSVFSSPARGELRSRGCSGGRGVRGLLCIAASTTRPWPFRFFLALSLIFEFS